MNRERNPKSIVVLGASRGVGRVVVEELASQGNPVLAVARGENDLHSLTGANTLALDATRDEAPEIILNRITPDAIVVCGGALPCAQPIQTLDWKTFSAVWETDVRMSLNFVKAAITQPLKPGTVIILVSSGAGINGSPISGGFAGAKKMQMFLTGYAQKESDRLGLGLRFYCAVPMRPMAGTGVGEVGINGYAQWLAVPREEFLKRLVNAPSPADVSQTVERLIFDDTIPAGTLHQIYADGTIVEPALP